MRDIQKPAQSEIFFSICIPQYNRTSFLLEVCRSLAVQTFRDFEICIADDCSTDGREAELVAFLEQSGMCFIYHRQLQNMRYDGNLRTAIGLARGRYCFLLGNDDTLATTTTLAEIYADLCAYTDVGAVITNYEEFNGTRSYMRMQHTGIIGSGPAVAAQAFRNFSFISGVLLRREQAQVHATDRWDGSEMYQMYIGCRMISQGASLLAVARTVIRKDIQIAGEQVDSYAVKLQNTDRSIIERRLALSMLGRVVVDAISPALNNQLHSHLIARVFIQILVFTYPYWLIEYRRVHSWQYALGVCLGMRPRYLLEGISIAWPERLMINAVYVLASVGGLLIPAGLFGWFQEPLYRFAKAVFIRPQRKKDQ